MGDTNKNENQNKNETQSVLHLFTNYNVPLSERWHLINSGGILSAELRHDAVCEFLTLAAYGQEKQVLDLLQLHPQLILETGLIRDYSGRMIQGTVYQIALGAEDTDLCQKLDNIFARIENGKEEKIKQFNAQFPPEQYPNGIENTPSDYDFSALVTAITNDNFANKLPNNATQKALQKFRDDFTPKRENVITTGKHFNMQHIVKAFEIYNENCHKPWNYQQRSLFWRQVLGYLQRFAPACYAQAFCQGLYRSVEVKKLVERKFNLEKGGVYFPLAESFSGLGWDFGAYTYWGGAGGSPAGGLSVTDDILKKYIVQKHQDFENLKPVCTQTTSNSPKFQTTNCK